MKESSRGGSFGSGSDPNQFRLRNTDGIKKDRVLATTMELNWLFIQEQWIASFERNYSISAKIWEGELAIWITPSEWFTEVSIPVSHEAIPKDWIVCQGDLKGLVEPPFPEDSGGHVVKFGFGFQIQKTRADLSG
jgi:hypothetical protein